MKSHFTEVQDFRVQGRCLHYLWDILGLVLCGVLADCDDFVEICDYGKDNIEFLQKELGFDFPNGIPSEDTLERVFKYLETQEVEKAYNNLLSDISLKNKQISIDGKELRSCIPKGKKHSLVQMVNVWVSEHQLSFGQTKVEEKSNEITAIPELLDTLDCQGSIISIDAIACQKEIVSKIVEKKADYVISLKKNQAELYHQAEQELSRQIKELPHYVSRDLGHDRAEKRTVYVLENLDFIDSLQEWKNVNSIILVERIIQRNGKEVTSNSLFISSLKDVSPEKLGEYIRNHWSIENQLHWHLDVTFGEDDSRIKKENAIINLHLIRKWALNLLKKNKEKISIKRKRKKAARSNQFLKNIILSS